MLESITTLFNDYFSGANGLKILSIALIAFAVILFLFLIIVLYVKSIIVFLRNDRPEQKRSEIFFKALGEEEQERQRELEAERELEKELENSNLERVSEEQRTLEKQQREDEYKEKELEREALKKHRRKNTFLDLDWQKGKQSEFSQAGFSLKLVSLEYQQSKKDLSDLLGLIMDMLGRGVDDLKIAQTVMYRSQGSSAEETIMQTIDAIKDFIALCINERFQAVVQNPKFPSEERALFHLAKGDASLSLALLEELMHLSVNESLKLPNGAGRDAVLHESSHHAITFGSLAGLNDVHLATTSFELAIELNPRNVNAWGRLGDMYYLAGVQKKSAWAYENMLKLAEPDLYPRQVANAYKMLAKYRYEEGDSLEAAKLYNNSKAYYDAIGINRSLSKNELEIVDIIEARQGQDVENTVAKILQSKRLNQYSYG